MKKLLIFAVLCLLFLGACANEPELIATDMLTDSGEVFRLAGNEAVDFYFYYPENFILDKNAMMISVFAANPEWAEIEFESSVLSVPVNANLSAYVVSLVGDYADAEQYWQEYVMPTLDLAFQDLYIEYSGDIIIAELPGRKYIYTASLGGQEYKYAQVIFFRNADVYTLTYTATSGKFDKHLKVLDIVVETFTFK